MSTYTVGIISVTVASALMTMLASGSKFEKICLSVSCLAIALCVIAPAVRLIGYDFTDNAVEVSRQIEDEAAAAVIDECKSELEGSVAASVAENFSGCSVSGISIELATFDHMNVSVKSVDITASGVTEQELLNYLSELLDCSDVRVNIVERDDEY